MYYKTFNSGSTYYFVKNYNRGEPIYYYDNKLETGRTIRSIFESSGFFYDDEFTYYYENSSVVATEETTPYNTQTYNTFINAGYDENGTSCGVYLKDIKLIKIEDYTTTEANDVIYLDNYIGDETSIIVPHGAWIE